MQFVYVNYTLIILFKTRKTKRKLNTYVKIKVKFLFTLLSFPSRSSLQW